MAQFSEPQITRYLSPNLIADYFQLAPAALLIYDCLLTIGSEVRFIWGSKTRAAPVFFLNRVTMVGLAVTGILGMLSWPSTEMSTHSCEGILITNEIFITASYIIWSWVSAIRVKALSQSRALACVTLLLGLMPIVSNMVLYAKTKFLTVSLTPSFTTCATDASISPSLDTRCASFMDSDILATSPFDATLLLDAVLYASRACAIAGDLIVIVVTWYKTSGDGNKLRVFCLREMLRGRRDAPTLADLLIRDGMLCFLVLLILNVAQMVTSFQTAYGVLNVFITSMASVLVSRLLINLNEAVDQDVALEPHTQLGSYWLGSIAQTQTEVPTIIFARVLPGPGAGHILFAEPQYF
ncbi:uncharacterized protein C8Q71DRAFT_887717 [Rhodofomes roseus]|uniref:DUF6533 domain-containing protein n=1 Tax=Rhodofomes roseus TaxID=34475 RepID=A0ABQ8JZS0_9APHY|nr:uncharacterized protein C8Q71DRAFT_887717 [Rhodofomes roseus]KAH9829871.1 hypothetical protein C8Q71DRAFT_887717 [Rhodofomes roseus]